MRCSAKRSLSTFMNKGEFTNVSIIVRSNGFYTRRSVFVFTGFMAERIGETKSKPCSQSNNGYRLVRCFLIYIYFTHCIVFDSLRSLVGTRRTRSTFDFRSVCFIFFLLSFREFALTSPQLELIRLM